MLMTILSVLPIVAKDEVQDFSPYHNPHVLFDQSNLLEGQSGSWTTPEELDQACEDEFIKARSLSCNAVISDSAGKTLLSTFAAVGVTAAGCFFGFQAGKGIPILVSRDNVEVNVGGAIIVYALGALGVGYVRGMGRWSDQWSLASNFVNKTEKDPMFLLGRQYARNKRNLNFLDADQDKIVYATNERVPYVEEAFSSGNVNVIKVFLSVPFKSKKPKFDMEEAAHYFDMYSQEAQHMLLSTCINHIQSYQAAIGPNVKSREFLNMVSPPGVGKTMLARSVGRLMGLPVETVCLANCTIEKIFGSATEPGLILEKLGKLGCRNGILFFDELERVAEDNNLLSILLPFLEPSEKRFYSPYLQRHIDVSHLLIMTAGNFAFTDAALNSRFHPLKTIELKIENPEWLGQIVTLDYLKSKVLPQEHALLTPGLKAEWAEKVTRYVKEQEYASFRDAQAKLDTLIASWRMDRLAKQQGKRNNKHAEA